MQNTDTYKKDDIQICPQHFIIHFNKKEINDQCRILQILWEKKVKYKEKKNKTIFTAKEKKVKIYFKLITEITSKEENWEREQVNFIRCYYFKKGVESQQKM